MLWNSSGLHGYALMASDGAFGTVSDFLFSDLSWGVRWLVADTGDWLPGRKVLIHPSALNAPDAQSRQIPVKLTKTQIAASPGIGSDMPVSMQMETQLYDHYGWDPAWGETYTLSGAMSAPVVLPLFDRGADNAPRSYAEPHAGNGDPHLRSANGVEGYHIHASDGDIGHVGDFILEDAGWMISHFKVETSNWWIGNTVLIPCRSIRKIEWSDRLVTVDLTRQQVKDSPEYRRSETVDGMFDDMSFISNNVNWIAPM